MLLTLSQSTHANLGGGGGGGRSTHDFPSRINPLKFRASPLPKVDRPVVQSRDVGLEESKVDMATPHRGLPPPAAMQLPDPGRPPPPMHSTLGHLAPGSMPAPPSHWQGHEESMRNWLSAKAEEDRRKQEEEKTRQENLKLEQRRIEQSMLRESLQAGVPPQMVPIIYAGMGGASLVQLSAEWLHQYATQLQISQQQQLQSSPELRAQRMIGQAPYPVPSSQPSAYTVDNGPPQPYSAYPRTGPTSAPRSLAQAALPRLSTNDVFVAQPPAGPGSAHPLQQSQTINPDAPASSPSIYFHHWVPPGGESSRVPHTPAKSRPDEPISAHPGSHASDGEHKDSPRKRKAQGGHQANPPPTTAPSYGSPSFSTTSSASTKRLSGHRRGQSATSFKEEYRPDSRREEHRFSFVPAAVREEDEGANRLPARREDSTAGAEVRHDESHRTSERASVEEQRPPPQPGQPPTAQEERG